MPNAEEKCARTRNHTVQISLHVSILLSGVLWIRDHAAGSKAGWESEVRGVIVGLRLSLRRDKKEIYQIRTVPSSDRFSQ